MLTTILIVIATALIVASWAMLPAVFLLGVATGNRRRIKLERDNAVLRRGLDDLHGALIDANGRLEQLSHDAQNSDGFQISDKPEPDEVVH